MNPDITERYRRNCSPAVIARSLKLDYKYVLRQCNVIQFADLEAERIRKREAKDLLSQAKQLEEHLFILLKCYHKCPTKFMFDKIEAMKIEYSQFLAT